MYFNEKLISLRRAKGLSQEQLANLIDVSRQAVSKWETAESQPDLSKLILVSNVFEVSLDELCGRKSLSTPASPAASPKPRIKTVWLCTAVLILGLALGLVGGFFTAGVLFPEASQQKIENVTITSFSMYKEPGNQKIHLVFSPSIAKGTFGYKVLKTGSDGNISSFPAIYAEGVCTCDVPYDAFDIVQGGFTLRSVISDGTNEYTSGLARLSYLDEAGYSYEELWNK